ncbi:uncharacterized protein SOCEGT47_000750 [Sorangium cellulosum]|uniref:Secreted protein n=1 Tax=Sorangium cellulosum TaxID=56 RepID=A0A4P2PTB1_SORCE|nr:hypothetical protein [Sorangium cellulosum]AUX19623.1 uncharacterized protein SOCEGT47_000750 [Sorangium cellulosum]
MVNARRRMALLRRLAPLAMTLAALLASAPRAHAREIFFDYGSHTGADDALELVDIALSRIVYSELGCPSDPVWLKLVATEGEALFVQLGMPLIEALRRMRPSLALVGPGLPRPGRLPFEVPAGLGAQVFATGGVREPRVVRGPGAAARSWLLLERRIVLPATGSYYLVAWSPEKRRVRLWIALGEVETEEISNVDDPEERATAFHQPWTAPDLSAPCAPARPPGRAPSATSCAHAAGPAGGALPATAAGLAAPAARRLRRRRAPRR